MMSRNRHRFSIASSWFRGGFLRRRAARRRARSCFSLGRMNNVPPVVIEVQRPPRIGDHPGVGHDRQSELKLLGLAERNQTASLNCDSHAIVNVNDYRLIFFTTSIISCGITAAMTSQTVLFEPLGGQ